MSNTCNKLPLMIREGMKTVFPLRITIPILFLYLIYENRFTRIIFRRFK